MVNTHRRLLLALLLPAMAIYGAPAMAQATETKGLPEGSKVYVTSANAKAAKLAKTELQKKGYWVVTEKMDEADAVMNVKVKRIWLNDRRASAVFTDARTQENICETRPVTTLWRFTFRPGHGVVKKLIRKRVDRYYEQPGSVS